MTKASSNPTYSATLFWHSPHQPQTVIATPFVGASAGHAQAEANDSGIVSGTLARIKTTGTVRLGYRDTSIPFSYLDRSGPLDICNDPPRPAHNHRCPKPCRYFSLDFHVTKFASHRVREWIAGIGLDLLKYGTG
jgi:hypothetical protein